MTRYMTDFYTSGNIIQTGTVQAKLQSAGIACTVCEKRIHGKDPSKMVTTLVLQISEEDRAAAEKIVQNITQDERDFIIPNLCPRCRSEDISFCGAEKTRINGIVPSLIGLPAVFPVYRFSCRSCSHSWEIKTDKAITLFRTVLMIGAVFFLLIFLFALL